MAEQRQAPDDKDLKAIRERMVQLYHDDELVNAYMDEVARHADVKAILEGRQTLMSNRDARKWWERTRAAREQAEKRNVPHAGVLPQRGSAGRRD